MDLIPLSLPSISYQLNIRTPQGHFNMIRLIGQFDNQLGHRLKTITLVSLISLRYATGTYDTTCVVVLSFRDKGIVETVRSCTLLYS